MTIADGKVVAFHYTLTGNEGDVLDSSEGRDPLNYLHGAQNIIPGLEKELTGKAPGDKLQVTVEPAEAYGEHDPQQILAVDRGEFEGAPELEPGMQFQARTEQGTRIFSVVEVQDDQVIVDGNHPLAGEQLNFDVEIVEVRDATEEELDHGHVHGPGGHEH